jgi:hypothetical protein
MHGMPADDLTDALSLTRERVRVWVAGTLQDTQTHWRTRTICILAVSARKKAVV